MRLGIKTLDAYSARVISSKAVRAWLKEQTAGRNQKDLAAEWGMQQPTVSRMFTQPNYDIPLNTLARIAAAFRCRELSEFFLQIEKKIVSTSENAALALSKGDKTSPGPNTTQGIEPDAQRQRAPVQYSEADLARHIHLFEQATALLNAEREAAARRRARTHRGTRGTKSVRRKPRP